MRRPDIPAVRLRDRGDPPRWLIVRHEAPEAPYVLVGARLRLGSAQDNEIVLCGVDIAGWHCTLRRTGDFVRILDHGAPTGTLVDNRPLLEPRVVSGPVRLILGAHAITVHPLGQAPDSRRLSQGFWPPHDLPRRPPKVAPPRPHKASNHGFQRSLGQRLALCGVVVGAAWTSYTTVPPLLSPTLAASSPSSDAADERPSQQPSRPTTQPETAPTTNPRESPVTPATRINIRRGETWASVAAARGVPLPTLHDANTGLRRPLRAGDRLQLPAVAGRGAGPSQINDACAGHLEIPDGSRSIGRVNLGVLDDPIHMPKLDLYELRCPAHAYATATTTRALIGAIRCFRGRSSYDGQIIIGDISAERGGPLGPHLSHQSGRDVDLWLPIAGGRYAEGCDHCGTSYCRPQPDEVDWSATWELIDALAGIPEVEVVFLDFDLQAEVRRAALESGANPATLDARLQWPRRGAGALVQHAQGHIHHIHIRFRCPSREEGCIGRPSHKGHPQDAALITSEASKAWP